MASESSLSDSGMVGSGENLRQNVLLAASGTIDTSDSMKRDSHIDIAPSDSDSDLDKDSMKKTTFWQRVFKCRENFVNTKSGACAANIQHDEKPLNKGGKMSNSITSLSTRSLGHCNAEKNQIKYIQDAPAPSLEDTGDCISELIGHIGWWQVCWVTFLIMFQIPSAFHIFSFMFQVCQCFIRCSFFRNKYVLCFTLFKITIGFCLLFIVRERERER